MGLKFIKKKKLNKEKRLKRNITSWKWNRFLFPSRYADFANSRQWVFIMGCTNSGTSLLSKLLASHPKIASFPSEGQWLTKVLMDEETLGVSRVWTERLDKFRMTEETQGYDSACTLRVFECCHCRSNA